MPCSKGGARTEQLWPSFVLDEVTPAREGVYAPLPEDVAPRGARGAEEARASSSSTRTRPRRSSWRARAKTWSSPRRPPPARASASTCRCSSALARDPDARALYLFPTKALVARSGRRRCASCMRDAGLGARRDRLRRRHARRRAPRRARAQRRRAHQPGHAPRRASCRTTRTGRARSQNLRYVVIDELHTYRGVFGSHVANVLRRLERVARFHGSQPALHLRHGDHRQPARARGAAARADEVGARRPRAARPRGERRGAPLQPAGRERRARASARAT